MQVEYNTRKVAQQYPAVYDDVVVLPPAAPTLESEPTPQNIQAGLLIVVGANLAVMVIVMGGMWFGGINPITAILAGVGYFTLTSPLYLSIVTGVLSNLIGRHEREITERQRVQAYRDLGEMGIGWKLAVEETRQLELMGRRGATEGVQRVSPLNSFVPAIEDHEEAQAEGVRFAMSLYGTNGQPHSKRVHESGRLKVRMCGSKRGAGGQDAGRWLLRERIIKKVPGGYALDIHRFPHRDTLRIYL